MTKLCVALQVKLLQVSEIFGAFIYMLATMVTDVIKWLVIYIFGAVAFAAGIFVLYRNRRASLGIPINRIGDDCHELDAAFQTFPEVLLFMIENTLAGADYWNCFRQSSSELPGIMVFGSFMVVIVVMLLNTLIAMMAETYDRISASAFRNYAFSFGKVPPNGHVTAV